LALLVEFASLMSAQVLAIENALSDSATARREKAPPFNSEAATDAVARLRILLEASDGDAEESFRSLQDVVAGAVEKQLLDDLCTSINDFDFDGALAKLDEIAIRLHTNRV
jgi:hypothetical protein